MLAFEAKSEIRKDEEKELYGEKTSQRSDGEWEFILFGGNNSGSLKHEKTIDLQHNVPTVNSDSHTDFAAADVDKTDLQVKGQGETGTVMDVRTWLECNAGNQKSLHPCDINIWQGVVEKLQLYLSQAAKLLYFRMMWIKTGERSPLLYEMNVVPIH